MGLGTFRAEEHFHAVMVVTWYIQGKKGILGKCVNENGGRVGADHGISRAR